MSLDLDKLAEALTRPGAVSVTYSGPAVAVDSGMEASLVEGAIRGMAGLAQEFARLEQRPIPRVYVRGVTVEGEDFTIEFFVE